MRVRRSLQHAVVLSYLTITTGGFFFTMTHVQPPLLPWPLIVTSYYMMSPYQGYVTVNDDILAEGKQQDGTWVPIELATYVPLSLGQRTTRLLLRSFKDAEDDLPTKPGTLREKYALLAHLLLQREQWRGRPTVAVRLSYQEWPGSPAGYRFLQHVPFTESEIITTVP